MISETFRRTMGKFWRINCEKRKVYPNAILYNIDPRLQYCYKHSTAQQYELTANGGCIYKH
jgi:hypothetical protein